MAYQFEDDVPERDVADQFEFHVIRKDLPLTDAFPPEVSKHDASLLAVSNAFGFAVWATSSLNALRVAPLASIQAALHEPDSELDGTFTVPVDLDDISFVVIAPDQASVIVASSMRMLVLDTRSLVHDQTARVLHECEPHPDGMLQLLPCPTAKHNLILVITSNSTAWTVDATTFALARIGGDDVDAGAWSPKGGQIALLYRDGTLVQLAPSGEVKKEHAPVTVEGMLDGCDAMGLAWLSTKIFAIYWSCEPGDMFVSILDTDAKTHQVLTPGLFPPFEPDEAAPYFHTAHLGAWREDVTTVIASASATDFMVVGGSAKGPIDAWLLDENMRAVMPAVDNVDTRPVGLALDFTATKELPPLNRDRDPSPVPPAPIMYVLSSAGHLVAWHVLDTEAIRAGTKCPGMCEPQALDAIASHAKAGDVASPVVSLESSASSRSASPARSSRSASPARSSRSSSPAQSSRSASPSQSARYSSPARSASPATPAKVPFGAAFGKPAAASPSSVFGTVSFGQSLAAPSSAAAEPPRKPVFGGAFAPPVAPTGVAFGAAAAKSAAATATTAGFTFGSPPAKPATASASAGFGFGAIQSPAGVAFGKPTLAPAGLFGAKKETAETRPAAVATKPMFGLGASSPAAAAEKAKPATPIAAFGQAAVQPTPSPKDAEPAQTGERTKAPAAQPQAFAPPAPPAARNVAQLAAPVEPAPAPRPVPAIGLVGRLAKVQTIDVLSSDEEDEDEDADETESHASGPAASYSNADPIPVVPRFAKAGESETSFYTMTSTIEDLFTKVKQHHSEVQTKMDAQAEDIAGIDALLDSVEAMDANVDYWTAKYAAILERAKKARAQYDQVAIKVDQLQLLQDAHNRGEMVFADHLGPQQKECGEKIQANLARVKGLLKQLDEFADAQRQRKAAHVSLDAVHAALRNMQTAIAQRKVAVNVLAQHLAQVDLGRSTFAAAPFTPTRVAHVERPETPTIVAPRALFAKATPKPAVSAAATATTAAKPVAPVSFDALAQRLGAAATVPVRKAVRKVWVCDKCGASNLYQAEVCVKCESLAPAPTATRPAPRRRSVVSETAASPKVAAAKPAASAGKDWTCGECMVPNDAAATQCRACETPSPSAAAKKSAVASSSSATVFAPPPVASSSGTAFAPPPAASQPPAFGSAAAGSSFAFPSSFGASSSSSQPPTGGFTFGGPAPAAGPAAFGAPAAALAKQAATSGAKWTCSTCMVPNPADKDQCAACDADRPGAAPKPAAASAFAPPAAAGGAKWTCGECFVPNPADKNQCIACEADRPGATPKPAAPAAASAFTPPSAAPASSAGFTFGAPPAAGSSGLSAFNSPAAAAFPSSFAPSTPSSGTTAPGFTFAPSGGAAAPGFAFAPPAAPAQPQSETKQPTAAEKSASLEPEPTAAPSANPFASLIAASKKKSWTCDTCMVPNDLTATKCKSCDADRPGTSSPAAAAAAPTGFAFAPPAPGAPSAFAIGAASMSGDQPAISAQHKMKRGKRTSELEEPAQSEPAVTAPAETKSDEDEEEGYSEVVRPKTPETERECADDAGQARVSRKTTEPASSPSKTPAAPAQETAPAPTVAAPAQPTWSFGGASAFGSTTAGPSAFASSFGAPAPITTTAPAAPTTTAQPEQGPPSPSMMDMEMETAADQDDGEAMMDDDQGNQMQGAFSGFGFGAPTTSAPAASGFAAAGPFATPFGTQTPVMTAAGGASKLTPSRGFGFQPSGLFKTGAEAEAAATLPPTGAPAFGTPTRPMAAGPFSGAAPSPGPAFGATTPFGAAAASSTPAFGKTSAFGATSVFGAQQQQQPAFGTTSSLGASPVTFGPSYAFGASPALAFGSPSAFGAAAAQGSSAQASPFGAAATGGSAFTAFAKQTTGFGGFAAAAGQQQQQQQQGTPTKPPAFSGNSAFTNFRS
ncbi:hypothetical protein AMAG_16605 [Allomyces macrogynus ATCC 38327]|uniref:Nuclear pore complex protein Nup153 n=1 Tax=Allomyces macrogynus (strain ATCC 38327) TaxID=578462 RepID=A0A0L0TBN9_ALLM3|nr:hypothetical protein AMAG_16605 [Allomyces macrogynus ATCC 38327]|eukprot:KNE72110.1 hypothetical protein AMAG_16605 [Allomyces macrogynus ATCC 38327]